MDAAHYDLVVLGGGPAGEKAAAQAAHDIAPLGAHLDLREEGGRVVATVTGHSILLPGITIRADTVAAIEPSVG